jgi:hypothetical protein
MAVSSRVKEWLELTEIDLAAVEHTSFHSGREPLRSRRVVFDIPIVNGDHRREFVKLDN